MGKALETISNGIRTTGFELRKHSPEIMIGAGIIGAIASTILACRATLKAKPVVEEHKKKSQEIHDAYAKCEISEKEKNRDVPKLCFKTGGELAKLYALPAGLAILSYASIVGSHVTMDNRLAEGAAAYMALSKTVQGYRGRVAEKLGVEEERDLWIKPTREELMKAAKEAKADEAENKKKRRKKEPFHPSRYARIIDEASPLWDENPEFTLWSLRAAETTANNLLETRKFLFLNDVYDILGFARTKEGSLVGWIYDPTIIHKIDFGIYDFRDPMKARFLDGSEPNIILEFNVDGVIVNKMPKQEV